MFPESLAAEAGGWAGQTARWFLCGDAGSHQEEAEGPEHQRDLLLFHLILNNLRRRCRFLFPNDKQGVAVTCPHSQANLVIGPQGYGGRSLIRGHIANMIGDRRGGAAWQTGSVPVDKGEAFEEAGLN